MEEGQQLELQHQKQAFFNKRGEITENWRKKHAELILAYERARGLRDEVKAELGRLKEQKLKEKLGFEERLLHAEEEVLDGEAKEITRGLRQIGQNLIEQEKTAGIVSQKISNQQLALGKKRQNLLKGLKEQEEELSNAKMDRVELRLRLARDYNENEKLQSSVLIRRSEAEKLEKDLSEMRVQLARLDDQYEERKMFLREELGGKKLNGDSVREFQHRKILDLERQVREKEIFLQKAKANIQRMAEVLSSGLNRAIVESIGEHRMKNF